jgi:hypothetical protein
LIFVIVVIFRDLVTFVFLVTFVSLPSFGDSNRGYRARRSIPPLS